MGLNREFPFKVCIVLENESPSMKDIADARAKLCDFYIPEDKVIGISMTRIQWVNFLRNLSEFEHMFVTDLALKDETIRNIMGFKVKIT